MSELTRIEFVHMVLVFTMSDESSSLDTSEENELASCVIDALDTFEKSRAINSQDACDNIYSIIYRLKYFLIILNVYFSRICLYIHLSCDFNERT